MSKKNFKDRLSRLYPDISDFDTNWEPFDFGVWWTSPQKLLDNLNPDQSPPKKVDELISKIEAKHNIKN